MIFPSLYEDLDMERYARLAVNIVKQHNIMVVLCDDSGQIVWSNKENKILAELIVNSNNKQYKNYAASECDYVEQDYNGVTALYFDLGELADRPAGEVLFYDIDSVEEDCSRILATLCGIAELIKSELQYLYEMNAMAMELGERYDELSMLRASDLELTEHRESRHILSTYIRSCAEHLNVDYAAIWLSSTQSIYPGGVNYSGASTEILSLLENLSKSAYAEFRDGSDGFGINDKDEELRRTIQLPTNKKVLLVPVLDANNTACGVLICLNEFYNNDFTNNDKSTLEAVSRKTYKYLVSTRDDLTGLLNRKGFEETLKREISDTERERYLVLFNIDQFSVVNAAYGIEAGDSVLSAVAEIISNPVDGMKYASRLDADVFAGMIETSEVNIEGLVNNICNDIDSMTLIVDGKTVSVKCRSGVIALSTKVTALTDHFYAAELALASSKDELSDQVVVYHPENTALLKRKDQLTQVENIKHALSEDRFVLYCQRIASMSGGESHYEILVRMIDEAGGLVQPDKFIPVAEKYGLMNLVDRWVIKNTFKLLCKDEYRDISSRFKWGINLSGMTISDPDFHDYVSNCLHEYNFSPTNLYFEVTETSAIKNFQHCTSFMNKINSLGVQFALDDFGSGLSSFGYLKKLSIDYLKIDGSLVKDIVSSRLDQTMVSSIADIAKVMNVKTIAEYVENDSILEVLGSLNIDYAQGYGIMKPQDVEDELKSIIEHSQSQLSSSI